VVENYAPADPLKSNKGSGWIKGDHGRRRNVAICSRLLSEGRFA
jgi:hypothetical protein